MPVASMIGTRAKTHHEHVRHTADDGKSDAAEHRLDALCAHGVILSHSALQSTTSTIAFGH
jgi:hypothetical protein